MSISGAWICQGCEAGCDGMASEDRIVLGVRLGLCDMCLYFLDADRRLHQRMPKWIRRAAERKRG